MDFPQGVMRGKLTVRSHSLSWASKVIEGDPYPCWSNRPAPQHHGVIQPNFPAKLLVKIDKLALRTSAY